MTHKCHNIKSDFTFLGAEWCTENGGFNYATPVSLSRLDQLKKENCSWSKFVSIFELSKIGAMDRIAELIEIIEMSKDETLNLRIIFFLGYVAPENILRKLLCKIDMLSYDERIETYRAIKNSGCLGLLEFLLNEKERRSGYESQVIKDRISDMLEGENCDLVDDYNLLSDQEYRLLVDEKIHTTIKRFGGEVCIFNGVPISIAKYINQLKEKSLNTSVSDFVSDDFIGEFDDILLYVNAATGVGCKNIIDVDEEVCLEDVKRFVGRLDTADLDLAFSEGLRYFWKQAICQN